MLVGKSGNFDDDVEISRRRPTSPVLTYTIAEGSPTKLILSPGEVNEATPSALGPNGQSFNEKWMKLVLGLGMGVLHRDLRAKICVRSDRPTELFIARKARRVERRHVKRDEPLPLLLGDPKAPMNFDEGCEAELSVEAVGVHRVRSISGLDEHGSHHTIPSLSDRVTTDNDHR